MLVISMVPAIMVYIFATTVFRSQEEKIRYLQERLTKYERAEKWLNDKYNIVLVSKTEELPKK